LKGKKKLKEDELEGRCKRTLWKAEKRQESRREKRFSGSLFLLAELVKGAKQILTQEHRFFWSNNP
jgi:hypothetical protein